MLVTRTLLASTATLPRSEVSETRRSRSRIHIVWRHGNISWSAAILMALLSAVLLIHGYHPLAEDGGLYVAGVEWKLNPSLFPHFTEFVSEHLSFSIFAPVIAKLTRLSHLQLYTVLFALNLVSIALTLVAARALLRRITTDQRAQLAGIATLAAVWNVPIAGTSLLLMDPYVTARSFSTPLSVWAIAFALDNWRYKPRSFVSFLLAITLAAAFHPLMAGYALGLIIVFRSLQSRKRTLLLTTLAILTFTSTAILQMHAPAESAAMILAAKSRYYWFLSQWHWYEVFGLVGPILVLWVLRYRNRFGLGIDGTRLCDAAILYGSFATLIALVFAHQSYQAQVVARLQPLRAFLMIYFVMFLLLGASTQQLCEFVSQTWRTRYTRYAMIPILLISGLSMFIAQENEFPESAHIESLSQQTPNPWVRAFLWSRDNTPRNALFALDANYITIRGEDAQSFRAIAQRSALPDFSKDGGEAAITPRLAEEWAAGFAAQLNLDQQTAPQLRDRLASYGVNWVVLSSDSPAKLACPYDNHVVKVCNL